MKKLICIFVGIFLLCGCSRKDRPDDILVLRSRMLPTGCSFEANITADYGDQIFRFTLACQYDPDGKLQFTVLSPESIAGIAGSIYADGGKLEFADTALSFPLLADGQLSPVSGPYIMMKALVGGYITSTGQDGEYLRVSIRDSYEEDATTVDIWLDEAGDPVRGEILWKNRRILTIEMENFRIA